MIVALASDLYNESVTCKMLERVVMEDDKVADHMKRIGYTWSGTLSSGTDIYFTKKRIAVHVDKSGSVFFYDRRTPR